jgi:hypothetical protein
MNVAIVYICTGKYDIFFEEFYESAEENFLRCSKKTYFVWTDSENESFNKHNVVKTHQSKLGWPFDTLMRFHMFNSKSEELSKFDYVFFFNANMKILKEITPEEILPTVDEHYLVGVEHAGYRNQRGPVETRAESTAYVKPELNMQYHQGCLFGGSGKSFTLMIDHLKNNVQIDLDKKIIAIWHDESHMNCYFSENRPKSLDSAFAHPENWPYHKEKICIQIDKSKFPGGHNYLRS